MEITNKKGCGEGCLISQLTNEILICGKSLVSGKVWLCNDCLNKEGKN